LWWPSLVFCPYL
jgi:hypothetical protein